jgi:hypothetical protein
LYDEKDAEDIHVGVDGLLRLAGTVASSDGNQAMTDQHRPFRQMDAGRSEDEARAMETDVVAVGWLFVVSCVVKAHGRVSVILLVRCGCRVRVRV